MNDVGFIHWPFVLTAEEADVSGEVDLEALDAHLDTAETKLWRAADAVSSMVCISYLWEAVDAMEHAQATANGSEYEARVTDLAVLVLRLAQTDHWPPAVHLAITQIAALRDDVREAA